jgi:hypothetical protein
MSNEGFGKRVIENHQFRGWKNEPGGGQATVESGKGF